MIFPVCWRSDSYINSNIHYFPIWAKYNLILIIRGNLKMQPTHNILSGYRIIFFFVICRKFYL